MMNGGPIMWESKSCKFIVTSTMAAEFAFMSNACFAIEHARTILADIECKSEKENIE